MLDSKGEYEPVEVEKTALPNGGTGSDNEVVVVVLDRKLTLMNGVAIIVGTIIGSGIFISPKGITVEVQSFGASMVVWLICGLASMLGAYCYAELGTTMRESGADYAYIYKAFGGFAAFLRLWVESIIIRPCIIAIVSLIFANYILEPFYPSCDKPELAQRLMAAVCILTLSFINCASVKLSTRIQDVFAWAKVLALTIIIITGFIQLGMGKTYNFKEPFEGTTTSVVSMALSMYSGLFAYLGWNFLNFVIEEMKDPIRDLPRAIFISVVLVMVVYLLTIVSYQTAVSTQEMIDSDAVGVLFARRIYGPMWWVIPIFVVLSTFGTVNGILFTSSRLCYVGGRAGHLPAIINMVQLNYHTPVPAVLFTAITSLCYLTSTSIYKLINYMGFVNLLAIGISVFILVYLRWKEPGMERPIKIWIGFPIIYLLYTLFLAIFAIIGQPYESIMGLLITLSGIPFYLIGVSWKRKPKVIQDKLDFIFGLLQKIFMVVLEDYKSE